MVQASPACSQWRVLARLILLLLALGGPWLPAAEPPSFSQTATPANWESKGDAQPGEVIRAARGTLALTTTDAVPLPLEVRISARLPEATAMVWLQVLSEDPAAKPLLDTRVTLAAASGRAQPGATISAFADGVAMATETLSSRTWSRGQFSGSQRYGWRFPEVRNLWEERDRAEIGSDLARLIPFQEKLFHYRLVLQPTLRQIWLDGRLVAEHQGPVTGPVKVRLQVTRGGQIESVRFSAPAAPAPYQVLDLAEWSHERPASPMQELAGQPVPLSRLSTGAVDLGRSLYRYRLTNGTGPNAPYVKATTSWPDAFTIDPAEPSFRVPHRPYQTAWVVAWVDEQPHAIPQGVLRFYREQAGHTADSPLAITPETLADGRVKLLAEKTAEGRPLYLLRVPLDTAALYNLRDMSSQFLEFQFSKPVAQSRGYGDPIYYGTHAAGPPSALRIVGVTLEEAPFDFELRPSQAGHLFQAPEEVRYEIAVSNRRGTPLAVTARLNTQSYDGTQRETYEVTGPISATGGTLSLLLTPKRFGWHAATLTVTADEVTREARFSLVCLPPERRTWGDSPEEIRFGAWSLLGHYTPITTNPAANEPFVLAMRKLGLRRLSYSGAFFDPAFLKRQGFHPKGAHTIHTVLRLAEPDKPEVMAPIIAKELAQVAGEVAHSPTTTTYHYGGEWGPSRDTTHATWDRFAGEPIRPLTEAELASTRKQTAIFTAIGQAIRAQYPKVSLVLQWGGPAATIAFLREGFPKELVDQYGMDQPMFEVLPEHLTVGSLNHTLWQLRQEVARLNWPQLPISWVEGPFLPTNPGALSEREQADHQVRYWLMGLAYGVENFEAGLVPFEAGNYYGTEHYGAGIWHRLPMINPKPAVASAATATTMLCGARYEGPEQTGRLSTFGMRFRQANGSPRYALWRIRGTAPATLSVAGAGPVTVTDGQGNSAPVPVVNGQVSVTLSPAPLWLDGGTITGWQVGEPSYAERPTALADPVAAMTPTAWTYDGAADERFTRHHFALARRPDPALTVSFGAASPHGPSAVVTLPVQPGDRPLVARYGALRPTAPLTLPGKPSHLGVWAKGNESFGRIIYELRDAQGELWLSAGSADDWNCDDTFAWTSLCYEGWRYLRFPLPGNHPYDLAREAETTWWGQHGGDGIVDWPVQLTRILVEARNEVPYLGQMVVVPERSWAIAGLTVEYAQAANRAVLPGYALRPPLPAWAGPQDNLIAELRAKGVGAAPSITKFEEPHHWADGRRMIMRFPAEAGVTYRLYLSLSEDGRGAELLPPPRGTFTDGVTITGLKPDIPLYLFLSAVRGTQESPPSAPFKLVTRDNFAEK